MWKLIYFVLDKTKAQGDDRDYMPMTTRVVNYPCCTQKYENTKYQTKTTNSREQTKCKC